MKGRERETGGEQTKTNRARWVDYYGSAPKPYTRYSFVVRKSLTLIKDVVS